MRARESARACVCGGGAVGSCPGQKQPIAVVQEGASLSFEVDAEGSTCTMARGPRRGPRLFFLLSSFFFITLSFFPLCTQMRSGYFFHELCPLPVHSHFKIKVLPSQLLNAIFLSLRKKKAYAEHCVSCSVASCNANMPLEAGGR